MGSLRYQSFDYPTVAGIATLADNQGVFGERGFAIGGCSSLVLDGGRLSVRSNSGRGADPGARRLHGGGDDPAARGTGAVRRGDPQSRRAGVRQGARRRLLERSPDVRGGVPAARLRGGAAATARLRRDPPPVPRGPPRPQPTALPR